MKRRFSLMNISLFTTMIAFSLTPNSLLSKNDASLRNPSLSYIWWFFLSFLEQFISRGVDSDFLVVKIPAQVLGGRPVHALYQKQFVHARRLDGLERAEMAEQRLGAGFADPLDAG